jgi:adenylate kinase
MRPNLHIFGIQGSGKDTQAGNIAKHYGLVHLSSGALFRARMEMSDTVGQFIAKEIHAGHLLPDEFLFQSLETALHTLSPEQGIICAGVLRTTAQYSGLQQMWQENSFEPPLGILLEVSEPVAQQRALNRNRSDDTLGALAERFRSYHTQTEPILEILAQEGRLIRVNGEQTPDEVFTAIQAELDKHLAYGAH